MATPPSPPKPPPSAAVVMPGSAAGTGSSLKGHYPLEGSETSKQKVVSISLTSLGPDVHVRDLMRAIGEKLDAKVTGSFGTIAWHDDHFVVNTVSKKDPVTVQIDKLDAVLSTAKAAVLVQYVVVLLTDTMVEVPNVDAETNVNAAIGALNEPISGELDEQTAERLALEIASVFKDMSSKVNASYDSTSTTVEKRDWNVVQQESTLKIGKEPGITIELKRIPANCIACVTVALLFWAIRDRYGPGPGATLTQAAVDEIINGLNDSKVST